MSGSRQRKEMDIDGRFARYCAHALSEGEIWALSAATMVMPSGSMGAEAYLTWVSGTDGYVVELKDWANMLAREIAPSLYLGKGRLRRRAYVEGYQSAWGAVAATDGLTLALLGYAPGAADRCSILGCGRQGYERIRDFVGGAVVNAIAEYRHALRWALREVRDRVFESRWESVTGLKWSDAETHASMKGERAYFPLFSPGCSRTMKMKDSDYRFEPDPETLYPGIFPPSNCWNEATAREMRKAPVTMIVYKPCLGTHRAATDE